MIHSFIALCIIINIFRINLGGFFRLIQVTSWNLITGYHQLSASTARQNMTEFIGYIKPHIVKCFAYRYVIVIFINLKNSCKDCIFCWAVAVYKLKILRRLARYKLFAAYWQIFKALAVNSHSKLSAHLGCHKGMCNTVGFKIIIKRNKVKTDFLGNNMKLCTVCQSTVNIHHRCVKAKGGICR